jgi:hypothetical protein
MTIQFDFKRARGYVEVWPSSSEKETYIVQINQINKFYGDPKKVKIKTIWGEADRDIRNLLFDEPIDRTYFFGERLDYNDFEDDDEWAAAINAAEDAAKEEALYFLRSIVEAAIGRRLV